MGNLIWVLLLCLAVVASVLTARLYYRRKYAPIVRQLSEHLSGKEEGESDEPAVTPVKELGDPADIAGEETSPEATPTDIAKDVASPEATPTDIEWDVASPEAKSTAGTDIELFKQLTDTICKEKLFLTPKFGRMELVERFHLSSRRVSSVFSSAGTSVPEFFRECRLEHARQLMFERPDLTLAEIATASGFIHASTFTVDFRNKYGTSPMQYREEMLKTKDNARWQNSHSKKMTEDAD